MSNAIQTIKDVSEELAKVLIKQFSMVDAEDEIHNVKFDDINIPWYTSHTWTQKQEDEFKDWLANELYNNAKLRKEIMQFPRKNKKYIKEVVEGYIFMWGFKLEKEDKNGI